METRKILLVEDDRDVARAMAIRLKSMKHNVVVAVDAISAISTARKEKPDLIILDLGLPGGDGFVVMKRLKSNMELMLIPIIVVSARDPNYNEPQAIEAGAEVFLQKPVDNQELTEAIERSLARSTA